MSGRRRRDDEWGDDRLDAQDDRRDPWADDAIGDWGDRGADPGDDAGRPGASSSGGYAGKGSAAGAYVRNAPQGGQSYAAPSFPSFQAGGGGDGYGAGAGQRGASNGYAGGGYGGAGRDAGYGAGRDTYQGAGYGRNPGGGNGYGRPGYGGGQGNDAGFGGAPGYADANGRSGSPGFSPEFSPLDNDDADDDAAASTPRPYGRLSIYTLHDDKAREFDRLAERAAEGVRASEPDTLVYVIHVVPKAPMQRIIYEIYRDRGAFLSHERQPHIRQFAADRASCVLATNIIDLRLKYAKVAALGSTPEPAASPQASWTPRPEGAQGNDRHAPSAQPAQYSSTQYSPTTYSPTTYSPAQYSSAQYSPASPAQGSAAASFTPAKDDGADNTQMPTVGREAYAPAAQYGNSGNGAYGASNGQYGAANTNGYSGAAGYANGGSYSSNGYPGANGYQGANGYSGDNGYSGANGYQSGNGYSGANGYSNGSGYSNGNGYPGANGYSNGGTYPGAAGNGGGNGYGAASGYDSTGAAGSGSYGAAASTQYTPRYRELTSGSQSAVDAGGYQDNGHRYQDDGRQSARPQSSESPRSQDHR